MDRIAFDIFEPDEKKFRWTPNMVFLMFWFLPVCLYTVFQKHIAGIGWLYHFLNIYAIAGVITAFICFVASNFLHEPLKGKLVGKLEFGNDFIKVDEVRFELKDITGFDLSLSDFYDRSPQFGGTLNPRLSQGVKNQVTFRHRSSKIYVIHFRLMGKHSYLSLAGFINQAVKMDKMSVYQAEDLIGKENVIQ